MADKQSVKQLLPASDKMSLSSALKQLFQAIDGDLTSSEKTELLAMFRSLTVRESKLGHLSSNNGAKAGTCDTLNENSIPTDSVDARDESSDYTCFCCHRRSRKTARCSGCGSVEYCSKECQVRSYIGFVGVNHAVH
jgi:hypothetical protein